MKMSSTTGDSVLLRSQNLSLQLENQQWRVNNARLSKDNQRMKIELANILQPPTSGPAHFGLQMEVYAKDSQIAKVREELRSVKMLNQTLIERLRHGNEEVKRAKVSQTQEFKSLYRERNACEETIAQRDVEIVVLKEGLAKKDIELEQLRLALQDKVDAITVLQDTLDDMRVGKDTREKELEYALQELDEQQEHYCAKLETLEEALRCFQGECENNGTTAEKLEDALRDLRQEYEEHERTSAELEMTLDDLRREQDRHEDAKLNLREAHQKEAFARYVWEFAAKIRRRWLYSHPPWRFNTKEVVYEGNRAAHDANILVDLALISLGRNNSPSDRQWMESIYGFELDSYICDTGKLKELKAKSKETELINLKASMAGELKRDTEVASRFRALLAEIDDIREKIGQRQSTEEEREEAFENNELVTWTLKEMKGLIIHRVFE